MVLLWSLTARQTQSPARTSRGCCSTAAACFQWEFWLRVLTLISGSRWMWYQNGIAVILPARVAWTLRTGILFWNSSHPSTQWTVKYLHITGNVLLPSLFLDHMNFSRSPHQNSNLVELFQLWHYAVSCVSLATRKVPTDWEENVKKILVFLKLLPIPPLRTQSCEGTINLSQRDVCHTEMCVTHWDLIGMTHLSGFLARCSCKRRDTLTFVILGHFCNVESMPTCMF